MNSSFQRPLRMGLVGGGGAGFIGKVHATAATLDREAVLVAGALSSNPKRARSYADQFKIPGERAYGSYRELLDAERRRDDGVDFISIPTPNHTHAEIAIAALDEGFHVVCDKPMTTNLDAGEKIADAVGRSGRVLALTHNYSGYPMMRQAREMVASGELGDLIAVRTSYVQGWMQGMQREAAVERGGWKSDPDRNGRAGSLGDVGTHAFHLTRFVSGLQPVSLLSRMSSYSNHHDLDDYGHSIIQFDQGATGMVTWSQVTHGRLNDLRIEIDGSKASLSWRQEEPNQLIVRSLGQPTRIYDRDPGADYTTAAAAAACRLPGGHPEAFFEAFANVYRDAFADMWAVDRGESRGATPSLYPNVQDGLEGVRFMTLCLESNDHESTWCRW